MNARVLCGHWRPSNFQSIHIAAVMANAISARLLFMRGAQFAGEARNRYWMKRKKLPACQISKDISRIWVVQLPICMDSSAEKNSPAEPARIDAAFSRNLPGAKTGSQQASEASAAYPPTSRGKKSICLLGYPL